MKVIILLALIICIANTWAFMPSIRAVGGRRVSASSLSMRAESGQLSIDMLKKRGSALPEYVLEQQNGAIAVIRTYGGNAYTWKTGDGIEILGKAPGADPLADDKAYQGGAEHVFPSSSNNFASSLKFIQEERAKKLRFDRMIYKLENTPETEKVFDGKFEYRYDITLTDDALEWEVILLNKAETTYSTSLGLKTYYDVSSLKNVVISGPFKGVTVFDKITGKESVGTSDQIVLSGKAELVFKGLTGPITITDSKKGTKTTTTRKGYADTIISNPGSDNVVVIEPVSLDPVTIPVGKFKETHFSQKIVAAKL